VKTHIHEVSVGVDCGGDRKTAPCGNTRRLSGHLDRRLDKADAAIVLVVLLVFPLLKAFDALDATVLLVRTEFLAIGSPPFVKPTNERR
jgi:hypothetical protein